RCLACAPQPGCGSRNRLTRNCVDGSLKSSQPRSPLCISDLAVHARDTMAALDLRPRRIRTFSQWLHRTSRGCLRTTRTPALHSGVLVAFLSLSSCMEQGTIILDASFETPRTWSCSKAARPRNARAHPGSAIDLRGERPRRKDISELRGSSCALDH